MRWLVPCLAMAILAVAPGRAHAQEPRTIIRVGSDESGRPCILSGEDPTRQLSAATGQTGTTRVGVTSLPACIPGTPSLSTIPLGHGSRHFDVRGWRTELGLPVAELGALFDEVYDYVSDRTGIRVEGLIPVTLRPTIPMPCPPRGRAWGAAMELFADSSWSRAQWLGVFAHELGHVLQFRGSPGIGKLGGQFMQGYASWAAGRYWTDWQGYPSLHAAVSDYLEREAFLDLSTPAEFGFGEDPGDATDCIAQRDIVLTEWASLVEHLVELFGREDFYARAEAAPEPGADGVDYRRIFDRSFEQIEADWLDAVRAQR